MFYGGGTAPNNFLYPFFSVLYSTDQKKNSKNNPLDLTFDTKYQLLERRHVSMQPKPKGLLIIYPFSHVTWLEVR